MAKIMVSTPGTRFADGAEYKAPRGPQKFRIPSKKCPPDAPFSVIVFELEALFEYQEICMVGFWKFGWAA